MVRACILIRVIPKKAQNVFDSVKMVDGVKKAMMVYGRFDIAALLEMDEVSGIVNAAKRINSLDGVRRTETLIEA
ncbi:MAG TPA: hypothetical protein EYP68_01410 [Candidatus Korarchaeota archaeon]|nr:hypothetical protein [Candidatus Korarchaeota archaeon]